MDDPDRLNRYLWVSAAGRPASGIRAARIRPLAAARSLSRDRSRPWSVRRVRRRKPGRTSTSRLRARRNGGRRRPRPGWPGPVVWRSGRASCGTGRGPGRAGCRAARWNDRVPTWSWSAGRRISDRSPWSRPTARPRRPIPGTSGRRSGNSRSDSALSMQGQRPGTPVLSTTGGLKGPKDDGAGGSCSLAGRRAVLRLPAGHRAG